MYKVSWNNNEIGTFSNVKNDMWYLEGNWESNNSKESSAFEIKIKAYDFERAMQNPKIALRVVLTSTNENTKLYCLAFSLEQNILIARMITSQEALDIFFPDPSEQLMNKKIKYATIFIGAGLFCVLVGLGITDKKEENLKYFFLFLGMCILALYLGISGKKPTYGGGVVRKYGVIAVGVIMGIYSIYLLINLL